MCGIAGIWNATVEAPAARVAAMLDAQRHRGPDGQGACEFPGTAAGMVRLALVDLSPRGQQPLWSPCGQVAILFNGEMYNFREERSRLAERGYRFQTATDTEVVLALYLERGPEFVERLRGMYAAALFDARPAGPERPPRLVLARDPLGIKPLYVARAARDSRGVVFASELRALAASGLVPRQVSDEGLRQFLTCGFVMRPATILDGVEAFPPGTLRIYEPDGAVREQRFWRLPPAAPSRETFTEAAERLRAALAESIRLHALADAPVGVFLSGGIDSTAVAALMRPHMPRLRAYTLRFPDVPGGDESQVAEQSARALDCDLAIVDVDGAAVRECLPRFAAELDQPSLDGLNTWLISRAAARDVKGVLSGLGGDEWFAGYPVTHRMHRAASTWGGRLESVLGALAETGARWLAPDDVGHPLSRLAARRSPWALWLQTHTLTTPRVAARATGHAAGGTGDLRRWLAAQLDGELGPHESPVGLSCLLDARVFMGCQLLRDSDATSMAHSLELRVPLVDVELAAFARSCPEAYKLPEVRRPARAAEGPAGKRVLLAALADVLPRGVLEQPKRGFALPLETWLRRDLREILAETCDPATIRRRGLVDPDVLAATGYLPDLTAASPPARPRYPRAWCLMILELWCRAVLDAAPRAAPPFGGADCLPRVAGAAAPSA